MEAIRRPSGKQQVAALYNSVHSPGQRTYLNLRTHEIATVSVGTLAQRFRCFLRYDLSSEWSRSNRILAIEFRSAMERAKDEFVSGALPRYKKTLDDCPFSDSLEKVVLSVRSVKLGIDAFNTILTWGEKLAADPRFKDQVIASGGQTFQEWSRDYVVEATDAIAFGKLALRTSLTSWAVDHPQGVQRRESPTMAAIGIEVAALTISGKSAMDLESVREEIAQLEKELAEENADQAISRLHTIRDRLAEAIRHVPAGSEVGNLTDLREHVDWVLRNMYCTQSLKAELLLSQADELERKAESAEETLAEKTEEATRDRGNIRGSLEQQKKALETQSQLLQAGIQTKEKELKGIPYLKQRQKGYLQAACEELGINKSVETFTLDDIPRKPVAGLSSDRKADLVGQAVRAHGALKELEAKHTRLAKERAHLVTETEQVEPQIQTLELQLNKLAREEEELRASIEETKRAIADHRDAAAGCRLAAEARERLASRARPVLPQLATTH
jgi:hypothetical protein